MNFGTLDIETYGNENGRLVAYCLCFLDRDKEKSFYGQNVINEFLNWGVNELKNKIIYVHNLSFDGSLIIEKINKEEFEIDSHCYRSSIYQLKIKSKIKKWEIILKCSYKVLPLSLKKIGKILNNLEKMDFPHDFVNNDNLNYIGKNPITGEDGWDLKKESIRYCRRDTEIVLNVITEIEKKFKKIDIEIFKKCLSISSLAINTFLKIHNKKKLNTGIKEKMDEMIRKGYYGGRCEVFGNKKENEFVYHFDFQSMYPSVMSTEFCYGKIKKKNTKDTNSPGFYNISVFSDKMEIPILPYRIEKENKLVFPNGMWEGTYWWEEIEYFKKMGGNVLKINYKIEFEKNEKVFEEFIKIYKDKRKEDNVSNVFWKLFINSMYGRFGMKSTNENTKIIICDKEYNKIKEKYIITKECIVNDIKIITYIENKERKNLSNVAIAAAITSKARIKLHKAYIDVIKNNGRVLYSDTDSIFAAFDRKVDNEKHGEVEWDASKEDTVIEDCVFAIPKGYAVKYNNKEIVKVKGMQKNSITFNEMRTAFEKGIEINKEQIIMKKENIIPFLNKIEKTINLNNYNKRWLSKDKKTSKPIYIV